MTQPESAPPRRPVGAALAAVAVLLQGCSGVGVLNSLSPGTGVQATADVPFMPGERGKLDVYAPQGAAGAPVVVFVYGGSWDEGRRQDYRFVGRALAQKGFVTMIPDYRVFPEVLWPSFLEDNARAVRWAKDNAARYGGDPNRMFLMGHSAGAYNVVDLATDRRWLAAVNLKPSDFRGVIGLAGPYDFLPLHSEELKTIFGPEDRRPDTQPINHVQGGEPPFFLGVDVNDKVVDPGNTPRFAARARAAGDQVEIREYKGVSHALLVASIGAPLRFLAPVLRDVVAFMRERS